MTTIVLDCARQVLYTDQVVTSNTVAQNGLFEDEWQHFSNSHTKVYQTYYGTIAGSGSINTITRFAANYPDDLIIPKRDASIIVCKVKGKGVHVEIFKTVPSKKWFRKYDWKQETILKSDGYITIGSGGDYAMGALLAGIHPVEAIQATSKIDIHTGYKVERFKLEQTL